MTYLLEDKCYNHKHMVAELHTEADVEIPAVDIPAVVWLENWMALVDSLELENQAEMDMVLVDIVVVQNNQPVVPLPNQVLEGHHNWTDLEMVRLGVQIRKGEDWSHRDKQDTWKHTQSTLPKEQRLSTNTKTTHKIKFILATTAGRSQIIIIGHYLSELSVCSTPN